MEVDTVDLSEDTILYDIIQEIAEKENCNELDLPPLYDSIDPDALNTLGASNKIQFEYIGYEITVENGMVTVDQ